MEVVDYFFWSIILFFWRLYFSGVSQCFISIASKTSPDRGVIKWCDGYDHSTTSLSKAWTQILLTLLIVWLWMQLTINLTSGNLWSILIFWVLWTRKILLLKLPSIKFIINIRDRAITNWSSTFPVSVTA